MALYEHENSTLTILPEAEVMLDETRKWANFLAIAGFILCGFVVLLAIILPMIMSNFGEEMSQFPTFFLTIIYLLGGLVYFFPSLYLYQFAERAKEALRTRDSNQITLSLNRLRACLRFIGILFIITLVIYGVMMIIAIAAGTLFGGGGF